MTFVDLDKLSPQDLILHYVLECKGQGHFLPYLDYQVIDEWLKICPVTDDLLLVLSEVLPEYFSPAKGRDSGPPRSLQGVKRLVLTKLKERAMIRGGEGENNG